MNKIGFNEYTSLETDKFYVATDDNRPVVQNLDKSKVVLQTRLIEAAIQLEKQFLNIYKPTHKEMVLFELQFSSDIYQQVIDMYELLVKFDLLEKFKKDK